MGFIRQFFLRLVILRLDIGDLFFWDNLNENSFYFIDQFLISIISLSIADDVALKNTRLLVIDASEAEDNNYDKAFEKHSRRVLMQ